MCLSSHQMFSIFVGDLSIFCNESYIEKAFEQFGRILRVRIAFDENTQKQLPYGFVDFTNKADAERAINCMNGQILCGRKLRVRWATNKNKLADGGTGKNLSTKKQQFNTTSVHVIFLSHQCERLITEESLRGLFSRYGEVQDVMIKKSNVSKENNIQKGYGFVHFANTAEGTQATLSAVEELFDAEVDKVNYNCSISHMFEKKLSSGRPLASADTATRIASYMGCIDSIRQGRGGSVNSNSNNGNSNNTSSNNTSNDRSGSTSRSELAASLTQDAGSNTPRTVTSVMSSDTAQTDPVSSISGHTATTVFELGESSNLSIASLSSLGLHNNPNGNNHHHQQQYKKMNAARIGSQSRPDSQMHHLQQQQQYPQGNNKNNSRAYNMTPAQLHIQQKYTSDVQLRQLQEREQQHQQVQQAQYHHNHNQQQQQQTPYQQQNRHQGHSYNHKQHQKQQSYQRAYNEHFSVSGFGNELHELHYSPVQNDVLSPSAFSPQPSPLGIALRNDFSLLSHSLESPVDHNHQQQQQQQQLMWPSPPGHNYQNHKSNYKTVQYAQPSQQNSTHRAQQNNFYSGGSANYGATTSSTGTFHHHSDQQHSGNQQWSHQQYHQQH